MKKKVEVEELNRLNRIKPGTNVVFNIIMVILALICIIPVVFVFMISISSEQSLNEFGYQFIPDTFSLSAYQFLWNEKSKILHALLVSVGVTGIGTALGVLLTTTMGYVLSRREYKLNNFFTWVVFIPMIFNGGMVANYVVINNILGLKDNILSLILPLAVSYLTLLSAKHFSGQQFRIPL